MQKQRILRIGLYSLMAMGLCFFSANQGQAASGNGPYYATPSWDQTLPAATRFIVLSNFNNEAVLDRNTGLVWTQAANTGRLAPWSVANDDCIKRIVAGQMGWRLPTVVELLSLLDGAAVSRPTLQAGHPFTVPTDPANPNFVFWSSTTRADHPELAWFVSFDGGNPNPTNKTASAGIWCVRGGNNADSY